MDGELNYIPFFIIKSWGDCIHALLASFWKWEVVDSIKYTQEVKGQEKREEKRREGEREAWKFLPALLLTNKFSFTE